MITEHNAPSTYILRDLIDVAIPESVSGLPQTMAWKVVALLLMVIAVCAVSKWVMFWWCNRYRKQAIKALHSIDINQQQFGYHLFTITKAALSHLDRRAGSHFGDQFLLSLERYSSPMTANFTGELGQLWMLSIVNAKVSLTNQQKQLLLKQLVLWLRHHSGPAHD
ncbi:DUF4381 family protein [Agarivorans sp. MS3-6]